MSGHVTPIRSYLLVYAGLIVLTAVTVGAAFLDFGQWHLAAGLGFGTVKALLVALIFMGVLYDKRLTWLVILASIYWLAILLALTLCDYLTRSWCVP